MLCLAPPGSCTYASYPVARYTYSRIIAEHDRANCNRSTRRSAVGRKALTIYPQSKDRLDNHIGLCTTASLARNMICRKEALDMFYLTVLRARLALMNTTYQFFMVLEASLRESPFSIPEVSERSRLNARKVGLVS